MKPALVFIGSFLAVLFAFSAFPGAASAAGGEFSYDAQDGKAVITGYSGESVNVDIPGSIDGYAVTAVGDRAFHDKQTIQSVLLPAGVVSVGQGAFFNCASLEKVVIPRSVTAIGADAFEACGKLSVCGFAGSYAESYAGANDIPFITLYSVSYDSAGGSAINAAAVPGGTVITQPAPPDKPGYAFGGWCTDPEGLHLWDFPSDKVKGDITLHARWKAEGSRFFGSGTQESPYIVESAEDLTALAVLVNAGDSPYADKYFAQSGNIELPGPGNESWVPIGSKNADGYRFEGVYDGHGNKIKELYIGKDINCAGLFGCITGTVKNLVLENACINVSANGNTRIGSVAGQMSGGTVRNCRILSGLVGISDNDRNYANDAGGITGYAEGDSTIENCSFAGTLNAVGKTARAGGIAGAMGGNVTILDCANTGSLYVGGERAYAGGIAGWSAPDSGRNTITQCRNMGNVRHKTYTVETEGCTGGIAGYLKLTDVAECFNAGAVTADSDDPKFPDIGGGVAGVLDSAGATVKNCYNIGLLKGPRIGGVAGENRAAEEAVDNCYYIDTCEQAVGNGNGSAYKKTINELKQRETYDDFDFTDTWTMESRDETNYAFPQLKDNMFNAQERNLTLTLKSGEGQLQGAGVYRFYDKVTIKAIPEAGYRFIDWMDPGRTLVLSGSTLSEASFAMPDTDVTLNARFEKQKYKVTLLPAENGSASSGASTYTWGDTVSLTAEPDPGYQLQRWEVVSGGAVLQSMNMLTAFEMPKSDVEIKAVFEPIPKEYEYDTGDSKTVINRYTGKNQTAVAIPERLAGYPVTEIKEKAFNGHTEITAVSIPNGVTTIGNNAFIDCAGITAIDLPDSVKSLGATAFSGCSALARVTIGKGLENIGNNPFDGCYSLSDIEINTGNQIFKSVKGVVLNKSGTELVIFPKGKSGPYAIPEGVTRIRDHAFIRCSFLTDIAIPYGVAEIGDYAFASCGSLKNVSMPDSVVNIGASAFATCSALEKVAFGKQTVNIGPYAFYRCTSLQNVEIPDTVTAFGDSAFASCSKLNSAYFLGKKPLDFEADNFSNTAPGFMLYYHVASRASWAAYANQNRSKAFCILTLDLRDGSAPVTDMAYLEEFRIPEIQRPSRQGYEFKGWYMDKKYQEPWSADKEILNDTTLYAKWRPIDYIVNFYSVNVKLNSQTVPYGEKAARPVDPTREGYRFLGWFMANSAPWDFDSNTIAGDLALYAMWEAGHYKVKLDPDSGRVSQEELDVLFDGSYGAIPKPERNGYTFIGWFTKAGLMINKDSKVSIAADHTLYAKWTANFYTVRFNADGGTVLLESRDYVFGSLYGDLPDAARPGYAFDGWFTQKGGAGTHVTASTEVNTPQNHILYAKWNPNQRYSITSAPNNPAYGAVEGAASYLEGETAVLTAKPKPGCMFLRWTENGRTIKKDYRLEFQVVKGRSIKAEFAKIGKPPLKNAASAGKGKTKLKWTSVSGVTGYYVYRSTKSGSGFKRIGQTATYTYTDKGLAKGKKYYYRVQAFYTAGPVTTTGKYSNTLSAKAGR
jgi:uncharacterized repeat protein (TIGR02543 family)